MSVSSVLCECITHRSLKDLDLRLNKQFETNSLDGKHTSRTSGRNNIRDKNYSSIGVILL